jgi:hypothetical protein
MNRLKKCLLCFFIVIGLSLLLNNTGILAFQGGKKTTKPAAKPAAPTETATPPAGTTGGKYSEKFDHFAKASEGKPREAHVNLTNNQNCEICHARLDNSPENIAPYHDSCVRCHAVQFADAKLEICADCHAKPYNDKPKVADFPKLNQFGMEFSHSSHKARADFKCETCHNTPADGKTARSTYPNHPECYTCHQFNNQPAKGNCNECHNDKAQAQKFRTRDVLNTAYNLFKFNHGKHLVVGRSCEECHDMVQTDATANTDVSRLKISLVYTATKLPHESGCFKCHDKAGRGADAKCDRCHVKNVGALSFAK